MKLNFKLLRQITFAAIVTTTLAVFAAQRKINIIGGSNSTGSNAKVVQLQNGSSTTVNYTAACYRNGSQVGATVTASLGPKLTKILGGFPCANGTNGFSYNLTEASGAHKCYGATLTNYTSSCAVGYSNCTYAQTLLLLVNPVFETSGARLNFGDATLDNSAADAFEVSTNGGATWVLNGTGKSAAFFHDSTKKCRVGVKIFENCGELLATEQRDTFCCPAANTIAGSVDSCEVTIDSSQTGFLQSPQFKGGAPF